MSTTHTSIADLKRLQPGDRVEAAREGVVHHRGFVEETLPKLGVVWIRRAGTGERKMLAGDEFNLRLHHDPVPGAVHDDEERPAR